MQPFVSVRRSLAFALSAVLLIGGATDSARAAKLHVGTASASITPDGPVALMGQRHTRISKEVESPCIATVLALASRDGERTVDEAVFVACDLALIPQAFRDAIDAHVARHSPEFDRTKLIVSATHTHTAPVNIEGAYTLPAEGVMQPKEYIEFAAERIAVAVAEALQKRAPATVGWGLGQAVVARNRLALYADGKAQMYGNTARPDFARFEGYEDHGVEVLFFWNEADELIATAVNVACPAQEVENRYSVNADFWHPVRETLQKKYGDKLVVLGWTGAGGDQSPHVMLRKAAETRMLELTKETSMDVIARRIVFAWEEAYAGARLDRHAEPAFAHHVERLGLPQRHVSQEEYLDAKTKAESFTKPEEIWNRKWHQKVIDRFEKQQPGDVHEMTLHVVRLGDTAIATNDFELYTDYGIRMKAASPAVQTFVLQLTGGAGGYLPADRSLAGGAYGSIIQSGIVGPEGGNMLVDKTLAAIRKLWGKEKP